MTPTTETQTTHPFQAYMNVPFDEVQTPGCYISKNTGNLYRIPAEALALGRSPLIEIVSKTGTLMTKISEDPWVPINKARQLCADADLYPNF
ncbi:MAG TPA: hypothetical protein VMV94_21040 [Phycisphaerae bacterium]|nr:hypothetical protein [Phycisphaerae bacterium]